LPVLLEFIANATHSPSDRNLACENTWRFIGNELVPTMLGVLAEPGGLDNTDVLGLRMCAIKTLGETDDDSVRRRLRELLADPAYEWLDLSIIDALGRTRAAAAVPQLLAIIDRPGLDPKKLIVGIQAEKHAAAEALAAIGTRESVAPLVGLVQALPAGWNRYDFGSSIMDALDRAIERTQDAELRAELVRVNEAVRALALDLPGTKPPDAPK
jgi:HEAT repeat protein